MNKLPMHNALKPLSWLEGVWRTETTGTGKFPTIKSFNYCEEITFTSIGQPMLNYTAKSWHPEKHNPMHQEAGFLKITPGSNKVSLFAAHNFGLVTIEEGEITDQSIQLKSSSITRNTDGPIKPPAVIHLKREFKLVDDNLHQVVYMATETTPELTEHLYAIYKKEKEKSVL